MNRRTALRNVLVITAGASLLPACVHHDATGFPLKNISLTPSDENLLAELAETIIPKTKNFVGAKELKAHEFIMTMVDDCASPEDQKAFTTGMVKFDDLCKEKMSNNFLKCSPPQRKEFLLMLEKKEKAPEEAMKFYGAVKHLTVQSFTSSKDYMINIRKYRMAPGPVFKGCVPVAA